MTPGYLPPFVKPVLVGVIIWATVHVAIENRVRTLTDTLDSHLRLLEHRIRQLAKETP